MWSATHPVGLSNTSSANDGHDTLTLMRRRVAPVDRVGVEERAAVLGKRSIKAESQQAAIRLAISMVDLTTLEGQDTPGKVAQVATGSPAGLTSMDVKLQETREAVAAGADEIDMVIPRDAYLSGHDQRVVTEVEQVKEACGPAHLKVIVEVDELGGYDHIRHATWLSMEGGGDFVKTSTGKVGKGATPSATLVMLETVRDYVHRTGKIVGFKAAGGVRTSKQAIHQLVLVKETLGDEWLTPDRFRIGASSLLNDLLMQYEHGTSGRYQRPEDFSKE